MPIQDRDYYRERRGTAPRLQGSRSRGGGRGRTATAVNPGGGSSGGHGCCWLILLLLIAAIGGGYYWYTQYGLPIEVEFLPTPTPTARPAAEATPTPSPAPTSSPSPVPTSTSTSVPCADPTPTPPPTPTPAPTATPTPDWPPQPLTDAWRDWASGWSRQQVDDALAESIAAFDAGLDGLDRMSLNQACMYAAAFEIRLGIAEFLVDQHRLERETVPGQGAAISWMIWLRHQRGLFAEAVREHAPVAECRSILAPPTPTPTHTPAPPTATPTLGPPTSTPLPPCPTATPTPPPTATPTATATPRPTPTPRPTATPTSSAWSHTSARVRVGVFRRPPQQARFPCRRLPRRVWWDGR